MFFLTSSQCLISKDGVAQGGSLLMGKLLLKCMGYLVVVIERGELRYIIQMNSMEPFT